jgi:hypothetical protein
LKPDNIRQRSPSRGQTSKRRLEEDCPTKEIDVSTVTDAAEHIVPEEDDSARKRPKTNGSVRDSDGPSKTLTIINSSTKPTRGAMFFLSSEEMEADELMSYCRQYWLVPEPKWNPKAVQEIYEHLVSTNFALQKIMLLEFNHFFEKYLWPNFNKETASDQHVLCIALMLNEKIRGKVDVWCKLICALHPS